MSIDVPPVRRPRRVVVRHVRPEHEMQLVIPRHPVVRGGHLRDEVTEAWAVCVCGWVGSVKEPGYNTGSPERQASLSWADHVKEALGG